MSLDIYIAMVSSTHSVAAEGKYIAILSTQVETANPEGELGLAFSTIGPVLDKFVSVDDMYEPNDDGTQSGIFVSKVCWTNKQLQQLQ